jgi:hypothetical protein
MLPTAGQRLRGGRTAAAALIGLLLVGITLAAIPEGGRCVAKPYNADGGPGEVNDVTGKT